MDIYPQIYYVYFYLRSKDSKTAKAGTPYYVGSGKVDRAWRNHRKGVFVPKDKSNIILTVSFDDPRYLSGDLVGSTKGNKIKLMKCYCCGKEGGINNMKRYHGDNCKHLVK